jgi:DNA processing protein
MATVDTATLVALSLVPGVGRATIRKVLASLAAEAADPSDADAIGRLLSGVRRRGPALAPGAFASARTAAEALLKRCVSEDVSVLRSGSDGWPVPVGDLADPPLLLYVRGRADVLLRRSCAIVGTREPSRYGEESARRIAARCAERGIATVSGLAVGIDAAVHAETVAAGGATVAVLPWGVDRIVPAANARLAEGILAAGGALVSELPPGSAGEPTPFSFIDRDRIQAALGTVGLVLVESGESGGAMHAVRQAAAMRRPVAAVVHPRGGDGSAANRSLVDAGAAAPLSSRDDLARWLEGNCPIPVPTRAS